MRMHDAEAVANINKLKKDQLLLLCQYCGILVPNNATITVLRQLLHRHHGLPEQQPRRRQPVDDGREQTENCFQALQSRAAFRARHNLGPIVNDGTGIHQQQLAVEEITYGGNTVDDFETLDDNVAGALWHALLQDDDATDGADGVGAVGDVGADGEFGEWLAATFPEQARVVAEWDGEWGADLRADVASEGDDGDDPSSVISNYYAEEQRVSELWGDAATAQESLDELVSGWQ